tara:strand:- start:204 stop:1472 length:1269 start_codon:yes stop_codon:yes gene_type:complete
MLSEKIGDYYSRSSCRFCNSKNFKEIINFGYVPLAGAFIEKKDLQKEKFYPLEIIYCADCFLVQVKNVISVDILFKEKYFFFSSAIGTLIGHFKKFANEIYSDFSSKSITPTVLEIGCNDGVLLKPLSDLGAYCVGVDPAENVTKTIDKKNIKIYNDCFTKQVSLKIKKDFGRIDAIISCYSFAHIDDMQDVMEGVNNLLKVEGILIFELYYLGTLIENMQYDNIYHEHMSYYSILSIRKFLIKYEMEIFDIKFFPDIRSGATRFYVKNIKNKEKEKTSDYTKMLSYEQKKGFNDFTVLNNYANRIKKTKDQLIEILDKLKKKRKTIVGYGASGRGTTIMNYCNIDKKYIDYVIDDAPAKHGFYTPGTHVPIKPWNYTEEVGFPDYIILFAWAFIDEVLVKRKRYRSDGGKFIIPLPEVKIV